MGAESAHEQVDADRESRGRQEQPDPEQLPGAPSLADRPLPPVDPARRRSVTTALRRVDPAARAGIIGMLQQQCGNAYVQRVLAEVNETAPARDRATQQPRKGMGEDHADPTSREEDGPVARRNPAPGGLPAPSSAAGQAAVQRTPQRRHSLDMDWYVEMEPATSIVPVGTEVTFRLRNENDEPLAAWQPGPGETEASPVFGVRVRGGPDRRWRGPINYPVTAQRTFERPGHIEVYFEGRPGSPAGEGLVTRGDPIFVSVELDIVEQLTRETVEAEPRRATYREDINRLEDPEASGREIAQTFQRVAVRRGIDIVNRNKQEAWDLLQMYRRGGRGRSATEATEELQQVARVDQRLQGELNTLMGRAEGAAYARGPIPPVGEAVHAITVARASLVDAFPALGLLRRSGGLAGRVREGGPAEAQGALGTLLNRVLRDCDTTRGALASGDLHIFDVRSVVNEVRRSTGIDSDPRRRRAIDDAIRRHQRSAMATSLGLAGASLALLLVPGLGPFMAAAAGLVGAGISWERAQDLRAAAGAGVRRGLVGQEEASAAAFWAAIETLLAGLDVAAAVRPLTRIAPHVPAAADRLVPRAAGAAAERGGARTAPRAASAAARAAPEGRGAAATAGSHLEVNRDTLHEFLGALFEREVRPLGDRVHIYTNADEYVQEFWHWWPRETNIPAGYFNPNNGHLYVGPGANIGALVHESVHLLASEACPMGHTIVGDFLMEGITESMMRARFAERFGSVHPYDTHVAFVRLLQQRVGRSPIEDFMLGGDYHGLADAVQRALGGDGDAMREFFRLVRDIGSDISGRVQNPEALSQAMDMLERMPLQRPPRPSG